MHPSQVIELRQYTLHPGRRDTLIELFEREFVETQEACGMQVLGQFRDLDADDRFVWLRGFADMAARARGLQAFYGGPVWAAHREAANATMVDSDDVHLLRPAWPGGAPRAGDRAPMTAVVAAPGTRDAAGALAVTVLPLREPAEPALLAEAQDAWTTALHRSGAAAAGACVTEPAPNNFPRLPVHEGRPVLMLLAMFAQVRSLDDWRLGAAGLPALLRTWQPRLSGAPHTLRLIPTARSAMHA